MTALLTIGHGHVFRDFFLCFVHMGFLFDDLNVFHVGHDEYQTAYVSTLEEAVREAWALEPNFRWGRSQVLLP